MTLGVLQKIEKENLGNFNTSQKIYQETLLEEFHEDLLAMTWVDLGLGRSNWAKISKSNFHGFIYYPT